MNVLRSKLLACATVVAAALVLIPAAGAAARPHRPVCPGPVAPGTARCHAHVIVDGHGTPATTTAPAGYGPAQWRGAYGLPSSAATSQTIGIVDAYDDPTAASDLNAYSATYGLPQCNSTNPCFQKVNQNGVAGSYPSKSSGWALEIALDVETAHAVCPNCKVLLVEAASASLANLETAVNTAARLGANEISNSYGGSEWSGEAIDTAYDHPGIAVTVASGDNGYGSFGFPAASPYVVAVGGTTLSLGAGNAWAGETAWNGSGSGCSNYLAAPSWETSLSNWSQTGCGSKRGVADVAADADPNTGAAVYDTTRYNGRSGWFVVGGTSLSSPLVAGIYALAGNTSSTSYPASLAFANAGSLHDVTSGSTGNCGTIMCQAGSGYDGPTGVGTPNGLGAF
jgi:subtilase family serine protease